MKLLVIGSGGREHAIAWRLAQSPRVQCVYVAPGNAGTALDDGLVNVDLTTIPHLVRFAKEAGVHATVVGPEGPLAAGVVDAFRAEGLRIFGPTQAAARLEASKDFAKRFMQRHDIPTAGYETFASAKAAHAHIDRQGAPIVIKADGLAAGKGVVVAADLDEAERAIRGAMEERQFGDAGSRLVVEECLSGPEVSFFAVCDGTRALPITSAQDHKRIFDEDRGPNTGGMGAFAPSPLLDRDLESRVMREIIEPVLRGMRMEGTEYRGFLYAGLMLTCAGPKVIEFNVRFGDPEAQAVMPLVDSDLAPLLAAAADGDLGAHTLRMSRHVSVGVVLASGGYPGPIKSGVPIDGLDDAARVDGVQVFHAGTALKDNRVVTAGGRVVTVVATGRDYADARARAYGAVDRVSFDGMQHRRDIGLKALGPAGRQAAESPHRV